MNLTIKSIKLPTIKDHLRSYIQVNPPSNISWHGMRIMVHNKITALKFLYHAKRVKSIDIIKASDITTLDANGKPMKNSVNHDEAFYVVVGHLEYTFPKSRIYDPYCLSLKDRRRMVAVAVYNIIKNG